MAKTIVQQLTTAMIRYQVSLPLLDYCLFFFWERERLDRVLFWEREELDRLLPVVVNRVSQLKTKQHR
jgi:hypothetical protein